MGPWRRWRPMVFTASAMDVKPIGDGQNMIPNEDLHMISMLVYIIYCLHGIK